MSLSYTLTLGAILQVCSSTLETDCFHGTSFLHGKKEDGGKSSLCTARGWGGDGQHCPLKSLQESLIDSTTPHSQASQEMERNTHHQRSLPSNEDRTNGPLETLL